MMAPAPIRLTCPSCGRYLCTVDGVSVECPPCTCGVQTTVRLTGKRGRQCVEMSGERIEVKSAR